MQCNYGRESGNKMSKQQLCPSKISSYQFGYKLAGREADVAAEINYSSGFIFIVTGIDRREQIYDYWKTVQNWVYLKT